MHAAFCPTPIADGHAINGDGRLDCYAGRCAERLKAPAYRPDGDAALSITPSQARLIGRRATAQLIASSRAADGSVQDQTRAVQWVSLSPEVAQPTARGQILPKANGTATIVARFGSLEAHTTVTVVGMDRPAAVSFRRDVIPAFSQAGCNTGACHGTPTGKGGFRLSLRGYLPDQDFGILSREAGGRRINPICAGDQPDLDANRWAKYRMRGDCG